MFAEVQMVKHFFPFFEWFCMFGARNCTFHSFYIMSYSNCGRSSQESIKQSALRWLRHCCYYRILTLSVAFTLKRRLNPMTVERMTSCAGPFVLSMHYFYTAIYTEMKSFSKKANHSHTRYTGILK